MQPVLHQCAQAGVVQLQQIQEWLEAGRSIGRFGRRGVRREQRELGRWRIVEEGLGPIEVGHFQRRCTFAQHGFQRGFPALVDVQLLPQARQFAELVFLQPRLNLALRLHVFLQLLQCSEARFELRIVGGFGIDLLLRGAAFFFQPRQLFLCFFELRSRFFQRCLFFFQLHLQVGQMRGIGQIQALLFLLQTFATHGQAGQNVGCVALMRRFQLDLLLRLHDLAARFGGFQLRFAPCLFQCRQTIVFALRIFLRLFNAHRLLFQMHLGFDQIVLILRALALPLIALRGQRIELRLQAAARFDDELDLRFQTADF